MLFSVDNDKLHPQQSFKRKKQNEFFMWSKQAYCVLSIYALVPAFPTIFNA